VVAEWNPYFSYRDKNVQLEARPNFYPRFHASSFSSRTKSAGGYENPQLFRVTFRIAVCEWNPNGSSIGKHFVLYVLYPFVCLILSFHLPKLSQ
jgi:hypothetical protein